MSGQNISNKPYLDIGDFCTCTLGLEGIEHCWSELKKICQQNPPESLNLSLAQGNITNQSQLKIEPIIAWT